MNGCHSFHRHAAELQKALEKSHSTMPSITGPGRQKPLSNSSDSAARGQPGHFENGSYPWTGTSQATVVDTFPPQNPHKNKHFNPMNGLPSAFENFVPHRSAEKYNMGDPGFLPRQQPSTQLKYDVKPDDSRLDNFRTSIEVPPIDAEAGKMGNNILDILWPGWPPTLPSPCK